jgi:hypothetical protein
MLLLHIVIVLLCLNVRQQVCQVACAKKDVLQAATNSEMLCWTSAAAVTSHMHLLTHCGWLRHKVAMRCCRNAQRVQEHGCGHCLQQRGRYSICSLKVASQWRLETMAIMTLMQGPCLTRLSASPRSAEPRRLLVPVPPSSRARPALHSRKQQHQKVY